MAMEEEEDKSHPKPKNSSPRGGSTSGSVGNGGSRDAIIFSPRFRSVAAMAGWDEESLILASFIVDDTPERESKQKKRVNLQFKTPPLSSRRKRRVKRQSPGSVPIVALNLDEEETVAKENDKKKIAEKGIEIEEKENGKEGSNSVLPEQTSSASSNLPCMDRLKEELSCAICLDICFEPSTTPCGHSFCKQCLKSAANKCGKRCPKCRQLISNGRYCTVNTVLWNTIQLLFPKEVEAKAAPRVVTSGEGDRKSSPVKEEISTSTSSRGIRVPGVGTGSREVSARRRRDIPNQAEDAALALRLQREEFMQAFRGSNEVVQREAPISSARANLRAMASRAMNNRLRDRFS